MRAIEAAREAGDAESAHGSPRLRARQPVRATGWPRRWRAWTIAQGSRTIARWRDEVTAASAKTDAWVRREIDDAPAPDSWSRRGGGGGQSDPRRWPLDHRSRNGIAGRCMASHAAYWELSDKASGSFYEHGALLQYWTTASAPWPRLRSRRNRDGPASGRAGLALFPASGGSRNDRTEG